MLLASVEDKLIKNEVYNIRQGINLIVQELKLLKPSSSENDYLDQAQLKK